MANIKDIEKIVSLGGDVNKLEEKIKVLKSQRAVLEGDCERVKRETEKLEKEVNQNILTSRQKLEDEIIIKNKELNKKEAAIEKKLKTISIREEESIVIEQELSKLNGEKAKIAKAKKELEVNNMKCLEMTNLAKLRAEQLAKTLEDLGKKPKNLSEKKEVKKGK